MTHVSPQFNSSQVKPSQSGLPSFTIGSLTIGSLIISTIALTSSTAWARPVLNDTSHFLLAQQVVDGLPPPPPVTGGQELLTGQTQGQQYLVVVNGDSEMLLSQVQQIQPTASLQDYNGQRFIQAGLFNDPTTAQQQVTTLANAGIGAQVVTVTTAGAASSLVSQSSYGSPATSDMNAAPAMLPPPEVFPSTSVPASPGEVEFGSSDPAFGAPNTAEQESRGGRSYYVIIPSSSRNISDVTSQISRLTDGMGIDGMVQTGTSHGSHIRVGPFNSRSAANRWTRYFRDFGMDARVSYGR
jgi:hypothetical protein